MSGFGAPFNALEPGGTMPKLMGLGLDLIQDDGFIKFTKDTGKIRFIAWG